VEGFSNSGSVLNPGLILPLRKGESVYRAQSPQAEPVSPSWKNIPMMAIIARRPLASSAFNLVLRCSGSGKPFDMMPTDLKPRKPAP